MPYNIITNNKVVPVSGIQIGENPCHMFDVNVDPITNIARLDYSFVSLEFQKDPHKVFSHKYMTQTEAINKSHNKKYSASRHHNDAVARLFGDQLHDTHLNKAYPLTTTTISFQFPLDKDVTAGEQEYKDIKVFITPTTGILNAITSFQDADKLSPIITKENQGDHSIDFDGSDASKLKLIHRFFKSQAKDDLNPKKFFNDTTKVAEKLAHEVMMDYLFEKNIQVIVQLDKKKFKALRDEQVQAGIISKEYNDYKKNVRYCSTDDAQELLMQDGVKPDFFKAPILLADNGLAIFDTAIARHSLITGETDTLSIIQCNRIGEVQKFQADQGIRPVYLKTSESPMERRQREKKIEPVAA